MANTPVGQTVITLGHRDDIFWIGDKPYPWAEIDHVDRESLNMPWRERRARLRFENGYTLSIVWGDGTYSSNHDAAYGERHPDIGFSEEPFTEEARTAELGVWMPEGELMQWPMGDTVAGYVPAWVIARLVEEMKDWPSAEVELPNLDEWEGRC